MCKGVDGSDKAFQGFAASARHRGTACYHNSKSRHRALFLAERHGRALPWFLRLEYLDRADVNKKFRRTPILAATDFGPSSPTKICGNPIRRTGPATFHIQLWSK